MITYTMNRNRELIKSSSIDLHRGDNNAGKIAFIIPNIIDDIEIKDLALFITYTLPNGDTFERPVLEVDPEFAKEGFTKFLFPITTALTSISGNVVFDLRFESTEQDIEIDYDEFSDDEENSQIVMYSGQSHFVVMPNSNYKQ